MTTITANAASAKQIADLVAFRMGYIVNPCGYNYRAERKFLAKGDAEEFLRDCAEEWCDGKGCDDVAFSAMVNNIKKNGQLRLGTITAQIVES